MAEGARLESVCRGNSTEGSNPSLSATTRRFELRRDQGEVPEWSNGAVSKTVDHASGPWVRIPPSPPVSRRASALPESRVRLTVVAGAG